METHEETISILKDKLCSAGVALSFVDIIEDFAQIARKDAIHSGNPAKTAMIYIIRATKELEGLIGINRLDDVIAIAFEMAIRDTLESHNNRYHHDIMVA